MNAYLSRLNPVERRFVIGVGLLFFIVINVFWIRPHFSDWGNFKSRLAAARQKQANYQGLIRQIPSLQSNIASLGGDNDVPPEDQSIQFLSTIQSQGFQSGVAFNFPSRQNLSSNLFFIEQSQTISVTASEKAIVDFLYNIGKDRSLIRARAMSLRPDPNHYALNANITLVASYQRKNKTGSARATSTSTATTQAPKPAATTPTSTTKPSATSPSTTKQPGLPTKLTNTVPKSIGPPRSATNRVDQKTGTSPIKK
jgi:Tfp pilus assembly protein PilO